MRTSTFPLLLGVVTLVACPRYEPRLVGDACGSSSDCARGLICASDFICRVEGDLGTVPLEGACSSSSECRHDLLCSSAGACAEAGSPGTAAAGETCGGPDDCLFGLECIEQVCYGFQVPLWLGATCPDPATEQGAFRVHFEVPRGAPLADFYRLPFPNDIRVGNTGLLDLQGHPTPGALIPEIGDVVTNALRVAEQEMTGFGNNQSIFFRFSEKIDFSTLDLGPPGEGTVSIVDITEGAEERGSSEGMRYRASDGRTPYICHNWLVMQPNPGRPFLPGHTYAAIVGRAVRSLEGDALGSDADFVALMADAQPADTHLAAAWARYAPLRSWLDEAAIDRNAVGAAAVFTVQDPTEPARLLREAVHAAPIAEMSGEVLCGTDADLYAVSGEPTRGCQTSSDQGFYEVQAVVGLPQFQQGTPPFKVAGDGGQIVFPNAGPAVQRTEQVHVLLTVPTDAPMPEGGWPLVIYGHGTSGDYTSLIRQGLADELSSIALTGGATVRFATLSFDAPLHGGRTHPENWDATWFDVDPNAYDSDVLFFNPLNPRATRDNPLQQAAELWALTRWALALDWSAEQSPTGAAVRFDPAALHYLGHSQGAVVGVTYAAYEPALRAVALSGGGGLTIEAFAHKTSPQNIPQAMAVGLADPAINRDHPLLNLFQQISERSDGVNHAGRLLRDPPEGAQRLHTFQIFGVGDTYSPDPTQYALARALGVHQVPGGSSPLDVIPQATLPVTENVGGATGVVHLYANAGDDAHFVLFDRADTLDHLLGFFGTSVRDEAPTVGPR